MRLRTRQLARLAAVVAATVGLVASAAGTAAAVGDGKDDGLWDPKASPSRTAYPGMFLDFTGDAAFPANTCTMGVVGTDTAGRKIGITAGHCAKTTKLKYDPAPRGVEIPTNGHPVFDRNEVKYAQKNQLPLVEPIGWIRWTNLDNSLNTRTDYLVIEFAPDVQLTSQVYDAAGNPAKSTHSNGSDLKVNSVYKDASGQPALPPQGGLLPSSYKYIEHYGAMSAREPGWVPSIIDGLSVGEATAPNEGTVTLANATTGMFRAAAPFQGGDSGGPAVIRGTGQWVGIITASSPAAIDYATPIGPWIFTSAKNILNDLNAPNSGRTFGVGFTPTNN